MSNRGFMVVMISLITFLAACRTSREIRRQADLVRRPAALIDATETEGLHFSNVSIKANISIKGEKEKTSFKATIRMKRDSTIWSTVTFFGIAGAKLLITRDSLQLINYRDKQYISEDYASVQKYLRTNLLTLQNLQAVLLGELPVLEEFEKLKLKLEDDRYHLTTLPERRLDKDWLEKRLEKLERKIEKQEEQNDERALERMERKQEKTEEKYENMAMEVWVNPLNLKVEELMIKDYNYDAELNIAYSNFKQVDSAGMVPHKVNVELKDEKKTNIEIIYTRVEFETDRESGFSIPNTYQRVKM